MDWGLWEGNKTAKKGELEPIFPVLIATLLSIAVHGLFAFSEMQNPTSE